MIFRIVCILLTVMSVSFAQVKMQVDNNKLKLGQQTVLKIQWEIGENEKFIWPDIESHLKNKLEIIQGLKLDSLASNNNEKRIIQQELILAKYNEDTNIIGPLTFITLKNNDSVKVVSDSLIIYPILENVDESKPPMDIMSPEDIPFHWKEILPYILLFIILCVLGVIIWLLIRFLKNRKSKEIEVVVLPEPEIKIPAHEIALEKLQEIRKSEKWFTLDSKTYVTEVTNVLREYIHNRWNFYAEESTSDEILNAEFIKQLNPSEKELLKTILETADFVKFAKANTNSTENKNMLDTSEAFVNITKEDK